MLVESSIHQQFLKSLTVNHPQIKYHPHISANQNSLQPYSIIFADNYESKTRYIYYFIGSNRRPGA